MMSVFNANKGSVKKISHADISEYSNHTDTSSVAYEIYYFHKSFINVSFSPSWSNNSQKFTFAELPNPTSNKIECISFTALMLFLG